MGRVDGVRLRLPAGAFLLATVLLSACGRSPTLPLPTATVAFAPTPVRAATATAVPPTPTALPPAAALDYLVRDVVGQASSADQQNAALEARLNAGTTLPPLLPALNAATAANERAAASISTLRLPPPLDAYRAVAQYQAETAAGYGALAEAWAALARAAQQNSDETIYQTLAGQATDRFHAAATAKDQAAIALGLAPEGSAPD